MGLHFKGSESPIFMNWTNVTNFGTNLQVYDFTVATIGKKNECRLLFFIYLKGCGTALKEAPPAAAQDPLPIFATKLESIAQCGAFPVSPFTGLPTMRKSWLIREAAQYIGKMKEETVRKKGRPWTLLTTYRISRVHESVREGKAYLHLKLNLAKSYKQEAFRNYIHSVMET